MNNGSAETFANHESIKRLKKQLEHTTDEVQRKTILSVLAEEEAKVARLSSEANADPDPCKGNAKDGKS